MAGGAETSHIAALPAIARPAKRLHFFGRTGVAQCTSQRINDIVKNDLLTVPVIDNLCCRATGPGMACLSMETPA